MQIGQYFKNKVVEPNRRYGFIGIEEHIILKDNVAGSTVRASLPGNKLRIDELATGWTLEMREPVELQDGYMGHAVLRSPGKEISAVYYGQDTYDAKNGAMIYAIMQIPHKHSDICNAANVSPPASS